MSSLLTLALLTQPVGASGSAPSITTPDYAQAFHRGDYSRAKTLASVRLKVQPGDVPARILLARAEAAMGHFDTAYAVFREAQRLDPRNPDALYYLGFTAGVMAELEYERLLAIAPGSARAHQLRGQTHKAQGRSADAEAELEAALEAGPPSADVLVMLGDLERKRLAFPEARDHYARAVELAPSSYDALYGLGVCDSYAGEHKTAIGSFRRALSVDPDSASARLALGISLLQTGDAAMAVKELESAAKLEPRMRQAYYQLGRAYQVLGRPRDAEAAFAKVKELVRQQREFAEGLLDPGPEQH